MIAGAAMTVIPQSSSAAVAVTLTAMHTGTIEVPQAAALVIGQNVGTTVTAGLAAIVGSRPELNEAQERFEEADRALDEIQRSLARVRPSAISAAEHERHVGVPHALDHLERLVAHARSRGPARVMEQDPSLPPIVSRRALERSEAWLAGLAPESPLGEVAERAAEVAAQRRAHRPRIMEETAAGDRDQELALRDAMGRDRVAYHWWRTLHHVA